MTKPMRVRARMPAPIATVRRALTDAEALRTWLAEHAEVELPHRYEFWGRYTPEGDAPHQRLLHADDHTLRFTWTLDGEETTVEIEIEPEGADSTILSLSQTNLTSFEDMVAGKGTRSLAHTFWALAIANLTDYVMGRKLTPKCDLTSTVMREEITIDAAPEAVNASLMEPEQFRRWFGANIEIEPYVGGRWAMGGFDLESSPAKIVELEPGRKMSLDWGELGIDSWELEGSAGKTRLTFVRSGFDERHPPYGSWMGWLSGISELRRYHELSDWRQTWLTSEIEGMPEGILSLD